MEFVVERILDCRRRSRLIEYYVKWKNCDESENSWETKRSLTCKDLIKQFEQDRKEAMTSKRAASNSSVKDKKKTSSAGGQAKRLKVVKDAAKKDAELVPPKVDNANIPNKKLKM